MSIPRLEPHMKPFLHTCNPQKSDNLPPKDPKFKLCATESIREDENKRAMHGFDFEF